MVVNRLSRLSRFWATSMNLRRGDLRKRREILTHSEFSKYILGLWRLSKGNRWLRQVSDGGERTVNRNMTLNLNLSVHDVGQQTFCLRLPLLLQGHRSWISSSNLASVDLVD